jgi:hypothetical protein
LEQEWPITDRKSLEAQVHLDEAAIRECEASLATAHTNLDFTDTLEASFDDVDVTEAPWLKLLRRFGGGDRRRQAE